MSELSGGFNLLEWRHRAEKAESALEHAERALAQMRADWEMYLSEPHDVFTSLRTRLAEAEQQRDAADAVIKDTCNVDRGICTVHGINLAPCVDRFREILVQASLWNYALRSHLARAEQARADMKDERDKACENLAASLDLNEYTKEQLSNLCAQLRVAE